MKIHVVGSGSSGSCYLIENNGRYIALDAGVRWDRVMKSCDFMPSKIDCCLCTHAHSDHVRYYKDFVRNGIPVYSNDVTAKHMEEAYGEYVRCLQEKRISIVKGGYAVIPIMVPHENVTNSGFIVTFLDGHKMFYCTDFEYVPVTLQTWDIEHFLIAVNHSEEIPEDDSAREHRLRGHSSLETVMEFLRKSISDKTKTVTACHLSLTYADPSKIAVGLSEACRGDVKVAIAHAGETINLS